jgi:hypothetical protein
VLANQRFTFRVDFPRGVVFNTTPPAGYLRWV